MSAAAVFIPIFPFIISFSVSLIYSEFHVLLQLNAQKKTIILLYSSNLDSLKNDYFNELFSFKKCRCVL